MGNLNLLLVIWVGLPSIKTISNAHYLLWLTLESLIRLLFIEAEWCIYGNLTIIGSDNGLSPGGCQTTVWTNVGKLLIWPLGTNFSELLFEILVHSRKCICPYTWWCHVTETLDVTVPLFKESTSHWWIHKGPVIQSSDVCCWNGQTVLTNSWVAID